MGVLAVSVAISLPAVSLLMERNRYDGTQGASLSDRGAVILGLDRSPGGLHAVKLALNSEATEGNEEMGGWEWGTKSIGHRHQLWLFGIWAVASIQL